MAKLVDENTLVYETRNGDITMKRIETWISQERYAEIEVLSRAQLFTWKEFVDSALRDAYKRELRLFQSGELSTFHERRLKHR